MRYQITGFIKLSELDDFEHGCSGELSECFIKRMIYGKSLPDLIDKCRDFTGADLVPDLIESNRLDFQSMETSEGYSMSEHETELWKAGNFTAYACTYSAYVVKVRDANLTTEFNIYMKGKTK